MTIRAKICGLNDPAAVRAAVEGGAAFIGLVFYPPSPRAVTPGQAAELAALVPAGVGKVGLFVDATDDEIDAVLARAPLDMLQLHGSESPDRVAGLRTAHRPQGHEGDQGGRTGGPGAGARLVRRRPTG